MELNIYKNKKLSIFFGFLDFSYSYYLIKLLSGLFKTIQINIQTNIPFFWKYAPLLQILLILSIFVSIVLYFFNNIAAYYMYFGQIILRFLFAMPSLGLLLKIVKHFSDNAILSKILMILCLVLDFVRFIFTIIIVKKSKKLENI